ncbi:hypothetical protein AAVH_25278 [Aphelenchoides avenae]|nr:hypothetical protein AAVH_25278 [Aphelenchus avenae]
MRTSALITVLVCCSLACTNGQVIKGPANERLFADEERCAKYCEVPCERIRAEDAWFPHPFVHFCKNYNPLGAGNTGTSGWLKVALILGGVLGCCVCTAVVYARQKSRRSVNPSDLTFENIGIEV